MASYTVTVSNNSSSDQNDVTVTVPLSENTGFVSWTTPAGWTSDGPTGGGDGTAAAWVATLPAGTSARLTLKVAVSAGAAVGDSIANTVSVGPVTGDPNPANNSSTAVTLVVSHVPTQTVFLQAPVNTVAAAGLNTLQVALEDNQGNTVTGDNAGTVSLSIASGPGGFAAGSVVTAPVVNGVATFSNLTLDTAGTYTLNALASGIQLTPRTSPAFTVSPAALSKLVVPPQVLVATAGTVLNGMQVCLADYFGNTETSITTGTVSLSIAGGPGGFAVGSTVTAPVVNGVATFSNLTLDTAGIYTFKATSSNVNLSAVISGSIIVGAAAPSEFVFTQQPGTGVAGAAIPVVRVSLEDAFGNVEASNSGAQVAMSVADGPAGFASSSLTTAGLINGVATFGNLVLNTAGGYTLAATGMVEAADGTSLSLSATSAAFTVSPSQVSKLAFLPVHRSATAGQALAPVKVAMEDQYGNIETSFSAGVVTLTIAGGPGGFASGTTSVVVSQGVAAFSNLVLDTAGNYRFQATSSTNLTAATSAAFTIIPAAASKFSVSGIPPSVIAGIAETFTVTAQDAFGNVATGYSGTIRFSSSDSEATLPANATLIDGVGTFSARFNTAGTQSITATDTANNSITGSETGVTVTGTAPSVLSIVVNNGEVQRSEVRRMAVTFSGPVAFEGGNANAAAAFQLNHLTDSNNVALSAAVAANAQGQTVVTLTFSGAETDPLSAENGGSASLADGRYSLTIFSASVSGPGGQALNGGGPSGNYVSPTDTLGGGAGELELYRLFGDATGNGVADQLDLAQFRAANNSSIGNPAYVPYLDADNSGAIDQIDLGQFRQRNNSSVFPMTPGGTPLAVPAAPPFSPPSGPMPSALAAPLPSTMRLLGAEPVATLAFNDDTARTFVTRPMAVPFSGRTFVGGENSIGAKPIEKMRRTEEKPAFAPKEMGGGQEIATQPFARTENDLLAAVSSGSDYLTDSRCAPTMLSGSVTGNVLAPTVGSSYRSHVSPANMLDDGAGQPHLGRLIGDASGDGADHQMAPSGFPCINSAASTTLYLSFLDGDDSGNADSADFGRLWSPFNISVF